MIEIVTHLNKAAFLMIKAEARLRGFQGRYCNNCKVIIEVDRDRLKRIQQERDYTIDYRKYMLLRSKLKMRMRKIYNPYVNTERNHFYH